MRVLPVSWLPPKLRSINLGSVAGACAENNISELANEQITARQPGSSATSCPLPSHRNQSNLKQQFEAAPERVSQDRPDAVLSFCDCQFSGARSCQLRIAKLGWLAGWRASTMGHSPSNAVRTGGRFNPRQSRALDLRCATQQSRRTSSSPSSPSSLLDEWRCPGTTSSTASSRREPVCCADPAIERAIRCV